MGDCVESCSKVKEDEYGEMSGICCHEKVVGDLCQSCFGAVMRTETRLKLFIEGIVSEMIMDLCSNHFFQDFGQKRKV